MFAPKKLETASSTPAPTSAAPAVDTAIGALGQYVGSAHRYRIQWEAGRVEYFIDGALVHTELGAFAANLNVGASDFNSAARRSRSTGCT